MGCAGASWNQRKFGAGAGIEYGASKPLNTAFRSGYIRPVPLSVPLNRKVPC